MVDPWAGLSHRGRVRAAARCARHLKRRAAPHHRGGTRSAAHAAPGARHPVVGDDSGGPPVVAAYFLDRCALVKRYAQETGRAWVEILTEPQAGAHFYLPRLTTGQVVAPAAR